MYGHDVTKCFHRFDANYMGRPVHNFMRGNSSLVVVMPLVICQLIVHMILLCILVILILEHYNLKLTLFITCHIKLYLLHLL